MRDGRVVVAAVELAIPGGAHGGYYGKHPCKTVFDFLQGNC